MNDLNDISRTGIYGVCVKDHKILLITQRSGPHAKKFDLPGGGIEVGETIEEALKREFAEELHMSFKTMTLMNNFTANVPIVDASGNASHLFHQIGLIYLVDGLYPLEGEPDDGVHSYGWVEFKNLHEANTSPILNDVLKHLQKSLI